MARWLSLSWFESPLQQPPKIYKCHSHPLDCLLAGEHASSPVIAVIPHSVSSASSLHDSGCRLVTAQEQLLCLVADYGVRYAAPQLSHLWYLRLSGIPSVDVVSTTTAAAAVAVASLASVAAVTALAPVAAAHAGGTCFCCFCYASCYFCCCCYWHHCYCCCY